MFTDLLPAGAPAIEYGLSANDLFNHNYPKYLRWALLVALLLTALGVWLMPRYEPLPYVLRSEGFLVSSSNPVLRFQPKADYPEIARRSGLEGVVVVNVLVNARGEVDQVVVTHPVHPVLDRAAAAAARRCLFEPAYQREIKVRAWVAVPYRFRLR